MAFSLPFSAEKWPAADLRWQHNPHLDPVQLVVAEQVVSMITKKQKLKSILSSLSASLDKTCQRLQAARLNEHNLCEYVFMPILQHI